MNSSEIQSEISAISKLVDSISVNQDMVTEIDRLIKEKEKQLNDRFVHVSVGQVRMHFLPPMKEALRAAKLSNEVWNSLTFTKVFHNRVGMHEEISFDKTGKGFAFFYTKGEVEYDMGLVESHGAVDMYYKVIEDRRETTKVTGGSVEVKLRAFLYLRDLVFEINKRSNDIATRYSEEITGRYAHHLNNGNR